MPGKILGLDIGSDHITAVQVTSGLKSFQMNACSHIGFEKDEGLEGALKRLSEIMELKSDTCFASIPGSDVSYRNLQIPFTETKKVRQTLPFELETLVPFPIEDLVIDHQIIGRTNVSDVLSISTKKGYLSGYLSTLRTYGIDPDILDVSPVPTVSWLLGQEDIPEKGLFIEIGLKCHSLVLYANGKIVLIRSFASKNGLSANSAPVDDNEDESLTADHFETSVKSFSMNVKNTVHSFNWRARQRIHPEKIYFSGVGALYTGTGELLERSWDMPVEQLNLAKDSRIRMNGDIAPVWNPAVMNNALALALRETKKGFGFNLRKDDFEARRHHLGLKKEITRASVILIFILLLIGIDLGLDSHLLSKRYEILKQEMVTRFKETFPEVKKIVDPVQQMKVKIDELKGSTTLLPGIKSEQKILDLLNELSQRIPKPLDVHLTNMVIDQEVLRISGDTDTFNTVDTLKTVLEPSDYFTSVSISSANLGRSGKRVQFEMKLKRSD